MPVVLKLSTFANEIHPKIWRIISVAEFSPNLEVLAKLGQAFHFFAFFAGLPDSHEALPAFEGACRVGNAMSKFVLILHTAKKNT